MKEELHQILLECGYTYTRSTRIPKHSLLYSSKSSVGYYIKDYETEVGVFTIALIMMGDPHIKLPLAFVVSIPEQLSGRLIPHICQEYSLCYVEEMEADWDPNDLRATYQDVDTQIQTTLNNSVASSQNGRLNDMELEGEFAAYWKAHDRLFLLSEPNRKKDLITRVAERKVENNLHNEYITVATAKDRHKDELAKWSLHRGITSECFKDGGISTFYISIKPSQLAGVTWPPKSFKDILNWLKEVDVSARDRIVHNVYSNSVSRFIFLLNIKHEELFAIFVEFDKKVIGLGRNKRNQKKKPLQKNRTTLLGDKRTTTKFKRLNVNRADRDTLLSRNSSRPGIGNLSEKKIALIGCGTIGGYLGALLLRNGAGCGDAYFDLFDDDFFSPHNFGRHILTANEFGKNKATALASNLRNSVHIANAIRGFDREFPIVEESLSFYDIVIDATGRPPVSKRLAAVSKLIPTEKRPILIHAFNDGVGRASKVLVDNGSCCYGCMLANSESHPKGVDKRFCNIDRASEVKISCGSTYMPYDAAVSHVTAALAQEAVLNTLESQTPWTYSEHMFDGSRSRKPALLKKRKECSICNDRC